MRVAGGKRLELKLKLKIKIEAREKQQQQYTKQRPNQATIEPSTRHFHGYGKILLWRLPDGYLANMGYVSLLLLSTSCFVTENNNNNSNIILLPSCVIFNMFGFDPNKQTGRQSGNFVSSW